MKHILCRPRNRTACVPARLASIAPPRHRHRPTRPQASSLASAPPTARAAIFTGSYISIAGLSLLIAPRPVFGLLFDTSLLATHWIRVGGLCALLFGFYYLGAAYGQLYRNGIRGFYWSTVWGRVVLSGCLSLIVWLEQAPIGLLLLAAANLVGAMSMLRALQIETPPPPPSM